ncbi:shikimate dehydrogenase [Sulfurimonas sp. HSL-1716]|uniref:shikimate dehydrogenase n=1 Tax=Hydrocurvibacter sulfurireducens TaxID=3131937 RepID=UPI0031F86403
MSKLYAIFGDPVSHSRSPLMHNFLFKTLHVDSCYTRVHLHDGSKLRETFLKLGLSGANITVPHKEAAFNACDEIRGFAKSVGVVNTIINENGRLIGYNTDADGFMEAIKPFGEIKRVLILGAGGTAKALANRFIQDDSHVSVLNRGEERLSYFKELGLTCMNWDNFICDNYDLVVNTTSAGLKDDAYPAPKQITDEILSHSAYAADAVYGKLTPFLKLAKDKGIPCKDGTDMLLYQGVLANHLFCDKKYDLKTTAGIMQKSFSL